MITILSPNNFHFFFLHWDEIARNLALKTGHQQLSKTLSGNQTHQFSADALLEIGPFRAQIVSNKTHQSLSCHTPKVVFIRL